MNLPSVPQTKVYLNGLDGRGSLGSRRSSLNSSKMTSRGESRDRSGLGKPNTIRNQQLQSSLSKKKNEMMLIDNHLDALTSGKLASAN